MRVKLVTFRYSATLGGFDDTALVDFARDKEVIALREHFYLVNDTPHITCVVTYQDAIVPREALEAAREIAARPSPQVAAGVSNPGAPWNHGSSSDSRHGFRRRDGAPDPCEGLDQNERALFNHLREWRSKQAHDEGLPPYLILTNKHLVALVRKRPESPTALGHIDGIGPGKIERYGKAILQRLHGAGAAASRASGSAPADGAPAAESPVPAETETRVAAAPSAGEPVPAETTHPPEVATPPPVEMATPLSVEEASPTPSRTLGVPEFAEVPA